MNSNEQYFDAQDAGKIAGRDTSTIRRWYSDTGFQLKYPDFIQKERNPDRGQDDVLIPASVLAKVLRDKKIPPDLETVQQLADTQEIYRLFTAHLPSFGEGESPSVPVGNPAPAPTTQEPTAKVTENDSPMIQLLKEQIKKAENERDSFRRELRESQDKILDRADQASNSRQLIGQVVEKTATLHMIMNRDIQRLRGKSLKPTQVSLQPIPKLSPQGTVEWDVVEDESTADQNPSTTYEVSTATAAEVPSAAPIDTTVSEAVVIEVKESQPSSSPIQPVDELEDSPPSPPAAKKEEPKSVAVEGSKPQQKLETQKISAKKVKRKKITKKKSTPTKSQLEKKTQNKEQTATKKKSFWGKLFNR